jgi:hypothetical protein
MHFENSDGEYIRYKDKPRFTGRGGARNIAENPLEVKIWARVLPDDKEKYFALGGSEWLRTAIREAYAAKARPTDGA